MIFMVSVWNSVFQHYTKTEISNLTGVSVSSLSQAQKKNSSMQAKHALVIARHMGVSVEELLTGVPSQGWHRAHDDLAEALAHAKQVVERLQSALKTATLFFPISSSDIHTPGRLEQRPKKPEQPGDTSNAPPVAHLKPLRSKPTSPRPDPDDSRSVREVAPQYAPDAASDTIGPVPFAGRMAAGPPIDVERWPDEWRPIRLRRRESAQTHYLAQAVGTSMVDAGIADGALVLVRRAEAAQHDQIVVVWLPGDGLTIKRYRLAGGRPVLAWEDGSGRTVPLREGARVQGVFVRVVE